jgi:DNA-directed RNA polymerase subunit beta'
MTIKKEFQPLTGQFSSIAVSLASPDFIANRSYGEVTKPETINYRTYKPERDGLFCEKIFGPVKDYECYCGKYKRIRYKGIICDRCSVEVTEKKVRRERMGHIKLVVPVVHIWFFKSLPSKIAHLLGIPTKKLEQIIYYEKYVVIQQGICAIEKLELLSEDEYHDALEKLPKENQALEDSHPDKFVAKMGAEGILDLLDLIELDSLAAELRITAGKEQSVQRKTEALKRLRIVESFREGQIERENKPQWTIISYLPVIPPELRPLVPLDGGRFASSDLNDLYRRVIIRNNRLKRLLEIKAPEVILRNEKRMLQEAVDSLFDNSRKSNAVKAEGGRSLKSLSDILKGKQGRFRQNLLGKRVDYSGRSVIVVGPTLKLHECGIPKIMASELFKPFIIRRLIERGIVKTVKSAKKMVERKDPIIWDILENILKGHPVMLNRAPTLHRLSIQAFQPRLIEGKAIQLHPLVCTAFNADFDGDQMAVHVPLSQAAILEAQVLMLSSHNILNPQDGSPVTLPSQDMVLGLYYLTKERTSTAEIKVQGEGKAFYSDEEVVIAHNEGKLDLHAKIRVRARVEDENGGLVTKLIETTTGRVLFNRVVPKAVPFINQLMTKRNLKLIIGDIMRRTNMPTTAGFLDSIKDLGFYWSFKGGLSFNLGDLITPSIKFETLKEAQLEVDEVWENFNMGLITKNERYNQIIDRWTYADNRITDNLMKELAVHKQGFNSVFMMLDSGARGSKQQIKQLCGMRGLMAKPRKSGDTGGQIIENPILSNFVDGLSVQEYFISTHGARKGLADTALKTADAGYLTRRLVDVAQDLVIREDDCATLRGIDMVALKENDKVIEPLPNRIKGRYSLEDVYNPETNETLLVAGDYIDDKMADLIEELGIESVMIRSVLTCQTKRGVCAKCYGKNLATGRIAEWGDAVGIIAAQSIGEPGTQLTLRTFHVGGVASVTKAESELVARYSGRLEFDNIRTVTYEEGVDDKGKPKFVEVVLSRSGELRVIDEVTGRLIMSNHVNYGSTIFFKDGDKVTKGDIICEWDPFNAVIITEFPGIIEFDSIEEGVTFRTDRDDVTGYSERIVIESKNKKKIPAIRVVTPDGEILRTYELPVGAYISIDDQIEAKAGQRIAKIPRNLGKIQDITGGLPRVTELFEARSPANPAVIAEIDGEVKMGKLKRGNRELTIEAKDGQVRTYSVALNKHLLVQDGDFVRAGMPLSDGSITPRDILSIKGPYAVQQHIVNGIQEVYRSQGININDKHIEVIVRQMMRRVEIVDPGDTTFLEGETVEKYEVGEVNDSMYDKVFIEDAGDSTRYIAGSILPLRQVRDENSLLKRNDQKLLQYREANQATSMPTLLGITKSSLGTESWISAASFQETTKVLSLAAISAKRDTLVGLKENVIVGKRIPAGTGMRQFVGMKVQGRDAMVSANRKARSLSDSLDMDHRETYGTEEIGEGFTTVSAD